MFLHLSQVRNQLSHRSFSNNSKQEIANSQNRLSQFGFTLNNAGKPALDWFNKEEDLALKEKFNQIKDDPWYKNYLFLLWFETTPYESIVEALAKLANVIKNRINTLLKNQ
ncbi:MAG: hypothetical protein ACI3ZZ_01950 [Candidatus Aphodosoma sp.]